MKANSNPAILRSLRVGSRTNPVCGNVHNVASQEILYINGSSGSLGEYSICVRAFIPPSPRSG
jgi:hypothetical protein